MKKGISPLQIGVFAACLIGVVLAILIFSDKISIGGGSEAKIAGSVTIWGTLPFSAMASATTMLSTTYPDVKVAYVEKSPSTFQSELVNALASGVGPDMITVTPADVLTNRPRLLPVPYESLPQSTFLGTFIDQSSNFMMPDGVVAFPLVVDPMVMYYNRDMLTSAFALSAPKTWEELSSLNASITKKTNAGMLETQTVALGTFDNIRHAKELITMLMFQAGNKLVAWDAVRSAYVSTFSEANAGGSGVANALQFYTGFANQNNSQYSWNPSLPNDRDQFVAGKLAFYFGYASEQSAIRTRNPNLNFDIAMMPQRSATSTKVTYGAMSGIAVLKMSQNAALAVTVAQEIAKAPAIEAYLSSTEGFVSARRDMLVQNNADARETIVAQSAIISQSWLDPDPVQTTALFRKHVADINAGLATPDSIITPGNSLLSSILAKLQTVKK